MEQLQKVLKDHASWLKNGCGERARFADADLRHADLSYADLSHADLRHANLADANLRRVNFRCASLAGANLRRANLRCASLANADLRGADLSGADLTGANLAGANLAGADLRGVVYDEYTAFFALQCPEEGAFVAWKKCVNNVIVKLLIPEDAKRSSATSRKCRASKAVVLEVVGAEKAISRYDSSFVYEVGKEVVANSFDDDRWNECSNGIHFFMTRTEAENY